MIIYRNGHYYDTDKINKGSISQETDPTMPNWETIKSVIDQKIDKEDMLETVTETVTETVMVPTDANGHEYVDLGLPSGTLWATMNVGANSITDYGNHYMYGMGSKVYDNADTIYSGTISPLPTSVDTAAQTWNGDWRMPTREQILELIDNTTYEWITNYQDSGVNGGLFTAQNGNSVFFPASGARSASLGLSEQGSMCILWSSTNTTVDYGTAWLFGDDTYGDIRTPEFSSSNRSSGLTIRPVLSDEKEATIESTVEHKVDKYATKEELGLNIVANGHEYVDLDLPSGTLWATMNVGATSPTEVGGYYMYGHGTEAYEPWNQTPLSQTSPNRLLLTPETDTATCAWGGNWETPSIGSINELNVYTDVSWITENNISCIKFASKKDSTKYIIIPAGGFSVRLGEAIAGPVSTNMIWIMSSAFGKQAQTNINGNRYFDFASNLTNYGFNVRPIISRSLLLTAPLEPITYTSSYNDLYDKPSIPAAQIQSDWNLTSTSARDYIKNKPELYVNHSSDIIQKTWGGGWHVPTAAQYEEAGFYALLGNTFKDYWTSTSYNTNNAYYASYFSRELARPDKYRVSYVSKSKKYRIRGVLNSPEEANGHEYVDYGLPSGTLWAVEEFNNGATYTWNLLWSEVAEPKYILSDIQYDTVLYDVANLVWGGGWHIPTKELWLELKNNTNNPFAASSDGYINKNLLAAVEFESTSTLESISLNMNYTRWTSTVDENNPDAYHCCHVRPHADINNYYTISTLNSYDINIHANVIRAVLDSPENANGHEYVDLGLPSGTLWATIDIGRASAPNTPNATLPVISTSKKTTVLDRMYDTITSRTNIKTINNESVLGSGNISAEKPVVIEAPVNATDATQPITALACEVGVYYRLDVAVETLAVTLPEMSDGSTLRGCVIYMTIGTTPNVTFTGTAHGGVRPPVYCQDGFSLGSGKTYEVNCVYNGGAWVVAAVIIDTTDVTPTGGGE